MKRWQVIAALALAAGILLFAPGAESGFRDDQFPGALQVGRTQELFVMPGGFTPLGKLGDPQRFQDSREHRFIPRHYGNLIGVTGHGDGAVLWFSDGAGTIRNVPVPYATARLHYLEMQDSQVRP